MLQDKSDWVKHIYNILTKYNNTVHSTIKIQPVGAAKRETGIQPKGVEHVLRYLKVVIL